MAIKKKPEIKKRGKGRPPGVRIHGVEEKFIREYPGQDARKEFHNPPQEDPEEIFPEPEDEASTHSFPPPKKDKTFRAVWVEFIDSVSSRSNFKVGHLRQLEILCDLHVEYEKLHEFIRKNGRSYKSVGRAGTTWKLYPEVSLMAKIQTQIRDYMKLLGLLLKKDHSTESGGEKDNWE